MDARHYSKMDLIVGSEASNILKKNHSVHPQGEYVSIYRYLYNNIHMYKHINICIMAIKQYINTSATAM